ncbi:MAG: lipopolysaccharide heptosyltransferase II [Verrucomicrobiota bacterium]
MKILILKPSSLGDVVHALPVLRLLRRHWPDSRIYWWLDINLVPLLEKDPDLAGIFPFQRKRWAIPHRWPEIAHSLGTMRRHRFDLAIDLQGLARSSLFAWLANAGLTVGLDNVREGSREGARGFYDLTPPRAGPQTHAVDRYMAVLPLLDVPVHWDFDWLSRRAEAADSVRAKWSPDSQAARWIVLLPGGRWDNKRWPVQYFATLVRQLQEIPALRFVVLGSKAERPLGEAIAAAAPEACLNLAGSTTLAEMIEWIRLSSLTIANDTGPMHVAAALGRPVIAIFGPTNPLNTGPYRQLHNVLRSTSLPCVPCLKDTCSHWEKLACLHSITPALVFEKARKALMAPPGAGVIGRLPCGSGSNHGPKGPLGEKPY